MRIILKPMGAFAIVCVVLALSLLALREPKTKPASPPVPIVVSSTPKIVAAVVTKDGHATVTAPGLGATIQDLPLPASVVSLPANATSGVFTVHVLCQKQGRTSPFPKYGIEIRGERATESYQAWIDPLTGVLARDGNPGTTRLGWRNSPLPPGFDISKEHLLQIRWRDSGKVWQCLVDGDETSMQQDVFANPLMPRQFLLKTEDTNAVYRDISVR